MSRIPYLSNELSPWPRICIGEAPSITTAVDQRTAVPQLHRDTGRRSGNVASSTKSRGRASSDAGPVIANPQVRGRSMSFGATQKYEDADSSGPVRRLDRKVSDRKVQELLELRDRKLKEARRKGDEVESFRLKNLNVFDDIERPKFEKDEPEKVELREDFTRQNYHHELTSENGLFDFGFIPSPKSVSHGHTATLCWHLKLQYTQGLTVPGEFSQCDLHPTPSPCASSSSILTLLPAPPSSLSPRPRRSLCHSKRSSIGSSSTPREFSELSSPAELSSTAIISEPLSPTKNSSVTTRDSSIAPKPEDEDPFLYIANYIKRHAKGDGGFKLAKLSQPQASSVDARLSTHIQCTCTNHNCRTYPSGSPSKHCRFCKIPQLQPEIAAAVERIEETRTSVLVRANTYLSAEESSEADEFCKFEALQEDMKLVEMYNAETERRCRNGIWWEGWLIVEDLKRQGVVGSKPFRL